MKVILHLQRSLKGLLYILGNCARREISFSDSLNFFFLSMICTVLLQHAKVAKLHSGIEGLNNLCAQLCSEACWEM